MRADGTRHTGGRSIRLESLFKALADTTRLRILALLGNNEVCVCHIHDSLGLPQPTVSRHLAYLRRAGLVDTRRDGVWMHYQVARSLDPTAEGSAAAVDAITRVPHRPRTASSSSGRLAICMCCPRQRAGRAARRAR
jgi:ArsR family transcriptional regulator